VPIAITAISGDQLANQGVMDITAPGLSDGSAQLLTLTSLS